MKKLLLLGGSAQQVVAIETAKKLGLYTIVCDYLKDNPGQYVADKFYLESTTDKEKILEIATREKIDGVVAYSSDPAAPTAAYVAEKLGLPGIPYETANSFCNKHLFRDFLKKNNFNYPKSLFINKDNKAPTFNYYPAIVKPIDSSGSKGVTVVHNQSEVESAVEEAMKFSRSKSCIIEQYIEKDHDDVIEAEIFIVNGKVAILGIMNTIRNELLNPLLPASYCYPTLLSEHRKELVKKEISKLVDCSLIKSGAMNIELVITKDDKVYFLDVGPRNGGNMLPEFMSDIFGINIVETTIKNAIGELDNIELLPVEQKENFYGLKVIHSQNNGLFNGIEYTKEAKEYLYREELFKKNGEEVNKFTKSNDAIGLSFFKFPSKHTQNTILRDFDEEHIKIKYKD